MSGAWFPCEQPSLDRISTNCIRPVSPGKGWTAASNSASDAAAWIDCENSTMFGWPIVALRAAKTSSNGFEEITEPFRLQNTKALFFNKAQRHSLPRSPTTTDAFNAIAEARRRQILDTLGDGGELTVQQVVSRIAIPQPSVSKHLAILRAVGLLAVRRRGQHRLYRLNAQKLKKVHD
jgi:DNA-binding transcriptional ArsR family regulator